jgi:hypothetical protein
MTTLPLPSQALAWLNHAAEALAVRPLLEQVAAMANDINATTVGEIAAISSRAEAWLRDNPPGQPVAIEPRGCPMPGACSCVEPTPPAPELGDAARPATSLAPVAELNDQQREAVHQAVAEALGSGAYDCLRVWSAWGVGTMGPDDFVPVAEDSDRVAEIADAAIETIRAIPAPQAEEVEA